MYLVYLYDLNLFTILAFISVEFRLRAFIVSPKYVFKALFLKYNNKEQTINIEILHPNCDCVSETRPFPGPNVERQREAGDYLQILMF